MLLKFAETLSSKGFCKIIPPWLIFVKASGVMKKQMLLHHQGKFNC